MKKFSTIPVQLILLIIATNSLFANSKFPNYLKKDTINGVILNEVKVYSGKSIYLETEKPKKFNGIIPLSTREELVIFFQEEFLSNKPIRSLSINFTKEAKNHIFQLKFYSIARELIPPKRMQEGVSVQNHLSQLKLFTLIPDKVLLEKEIIFSPHKTGWNEFILSKSNFIVPENGIAVVLKLISETSEIKNSMDLPAIKYGKYSIPKIFKMKGRKDLTWENGHEDRDFDKEYGDEYKYNKNYQKLKEQFIKFNDGKHAIGVRIKVRN